MQNASAPRAHDLRATFVTLALGDGRTDDWVKKRTGHRSDMMLNRYKREAETVHELKIGWFKPLHEAIPELAAMPASDDSTTTKEPLKTPSEKNNVGISSEDSISAPKTKNGSPPKTKRSQSGARGET
jgi:hypothetical protein